MSSSGVASSSPNETLTETPSVPRSVVEQFVRPMWRLRKRTIVLVMELLLAALSYALALLVLESGEQPSWSTHVLAQGLPLLLTLRLLGLACVRLFQSSLRYPSIDDLLKVVKAASLSSLLYFTTIQIWYPGARVPLALLVLDWALLQLLWGGLHCGVRVYRSQFAHGRTRGRRAVIVGAGDAGMSVLKELASNPASPHRPVAIVDDDSLRHGTTVYGVPIAGTTQDLARVARETRADLALICIPSATRSQMSRILAACREAGLPARALPTLAEIVDGKVSHRDLRSMSVGDLLQREEIHCNPEEIATLVQGKVVLVTGAGGSIGSELSRQVASGSPDTLLLLDKSENSLFYIHRELRERNAETRLKPLLVDLTCRDFVDEAMDREMPEVVFHAAAHKHVGLLELHPREAIRNNVLGTRNIALAALRCRTTSFVNISSDKAVNPRNYMGLSKRITELLVQELARKHSTRFMNVRFGNVAGSTGSVLRLFWEQIQKGGPVLVTDPRAERYFMSIPEAVYLILQAAAQGKGGETFVLEMGEPINIYELARSMSLLAGLMPGTDVPIHFVGLQQGEKVTEELWEEWENPAFSVHKNIRVITEHHPLASAMLEKIERIEAYLAVNDREEGLNRYLDDLVPRFAANRKPPLPDETALAEAAVESFI